MSAPQMQESAAPHTTPAPTAGPSHIARPSSPAAPPLPPRPQNEMESTPATNTAPAALQDAPNPTPATESPLTFNESLNAGDRYWKFKFVFQILAIIVAIIGIGCFAWLLSISPFNAFSYYGYYPSYELWPSILTWGLSIIWCILCIAVLFRRKRPIHPGLRVAMDLLLWLGFIVTALFATASLVEVMAYGTSDGLGYSYSSYRGNYVYIASNDTWVWEQDTTYVSSPRSCNGTSGSYSYSTYDFSFADCADQDAYINKLWHEKPRRVNVNLTGVVCQYLGLLLHFVLFVWACVDTNRYNRTKVSTDAEKLAAGIVQTMIQNGAIRPPQGQVYMPPHSGQGMYYQLPQQGQQQPYPMMYPQYMQGQYQPVAQGPAQGEPVGVPGPSNEKGAGPRYA